MHAVIQYGKDGFPNAVIGPFCSRESAIKAAKILYGETGPDERGHYIDDDGDLLYVIRELFLPDQSQS